MLLLFYDQVGFNIKNKLVVKKKFKKIKLKYYKIDNSLTIEIMKKSICANIKCLISNFIFVTQFKTIKKCLYLKDIRYLNSLSTLLCIKLNNQIYLKLQIIKTNYLDFQKNTLIFLKNLNIFIKMLIHKLIL